MKRKSQQQEERQKQDQQQPNLLGLPSTDPHIALMLPPQPLSTQIPNTSIPVPVAPCPPRPISMLNSDFDPRIEVISKSQHVSPIQQRVDQGKGPLEYEQDNPSEGLDIYTTNPSVNALHRRIKLTDIKSSDLA